jgi:hypothetical protein
MYILTYFHQNSGCGATLLAPTLPLGFSAITDHPKLGEVPPGCGLQSGPVPVWGSNQFPVRGHVECGGGMFSVGPALLLFVCGSLAPHLSWQVPETGKFHGAMTYHSHPPPSWPRIFQFRPHHSRYWSDSEIQLYFAQSVTRPEVASLFRVKGNLEVSTLINVC